MQGDTLLQRARDRVEELPGARLEHPFGHDWDAFKVRDRVFMLLTEVTGEPIVIVKADPEDGKALREQRRHHARLPHEQAALDHAAPWRGPQAGSRR